VLTESTEHDTGFAPGIPASVVDGLMSTLAASLRVLRTDFQDRSEQVIAAEWRGSFRSRAGFLEDDQTYFMITHALTVCLDVLTFAEAGNRAEMLMDIMRNWWLSVVDPNRNGAGDYGDAMMASFDKNNIPRPPRDATGPMAAVLGVVESISAMHRYLGEGPLTDDAVAALRELCLAGHALNAPEGVWERLASAVPTPGREPRRETDFPNDLTAAIVGAEVRLRARMAAATGELDRLRKKDAAIRSELDGRQLSSDSESVLTSVGIDLENLRALWAHKRAFDTAGFLKKLVMGGVANEISEACRGIRQQWATQVEAANAAVGHARAARDHELGAFTEQVDEFAPGPNSRLADWLRPLTGYLGATLAEAGAGSRAPHTLWRHTPVSDRPWELPQLANLHPNVVLFSDEDTLSYQQACAAARDLVLDKMSRTAPRQLLLTWIDPTGRGQSAGPFLELLELDKSLIDEKVWAEPDEIATALRRVSDRMANLEQRCLKDTFADLESYNEKAGSLAEPYHVVVITGFPRGFTEETAARLKQITEQGARLGISVVTVVDPSIRGWLRTTTNQAHDYPVLTVHFNDYDNGQLSWLGQSTFPNGLRIAGHDGRPHAPVVPDGTKQIVHVPCSFTGFAPEAAGAIVSGYAKASVNAADVMIGSENLVTEDGAGPPALTVSSVDVPLGVRGRGEAVVLRLGADLSQNVLVGGLPGSGKSTLFHTLITTAARRYSPRELEMYLLDFKQGVEFQPYADGALPHARVVAVQSEREFGLSVLRGLRDEITRRSELFRRINADKLEEYRERCGEVIPRVLVVVDEFQMMFADDDAIAHECARLLDHIVRQGRAFGLHLVLGTQTLRGQGTMSLLRGTLDQVAVRIVLKTSESDSRLFLADDNAAGAGLRRRGEAIFNPDGGRPEGNVGFQVAWTSDEVRDAAVRRARQRAEESGFTRRPLVFDGTREIAVEEDEQVTAWLDGRATPDPRHIRMHLGLPVAIGGSGAVALSRVGGQHLAILHRDPAFATGSLMAGLVTAVRSSAVTPRVSIVECLGTSEEYAEKLTWLVPWRDAVTWGWRRKVLASTLAEAAAEVRRRVDADDFEARPWLIVINALQRARELGGEPSFDETGSPQQDLLSVLADGSDVGVHVIVTADSLETVERRLGPGALEQFGARLVGQCSEDASQRILGSGAASRLGPAYALLDEPDENRRQTLRPFPVPAQAWVDAATERTPR
jgi:hypothetical protein